MCAITGQVDFRSGASESLVKGMSEAMRHRGPDASGTYLAPSRIAALAHRRLSIIDLSQAGSQPMASGDGRHVLVFNGEIYNYRELREKLEAKGVRFQSRSDTEVLLKLWQDRGEACLDELRGMFAFAVWDAAGETLTLARDPFGIKPLFYRLDEGGIVFASEVKAFRACGLAREMDPEGIGAFLQWGSIPPPLTLYSGIRSLPPGTRLRFGRDAVQPRPECFWDYGSRVFRKDAGRKPIRARQEAVEHVRAVLLDSTRKHLVGDVPVGAFLSGGIDSTSVVSLMRQAGQEKIASFAIGSERSGLDESPFSRQAAERYGTDHHEWILTEEDFRRHRAEILDSMDQPSVDGVNTWFVSKFVHDQGYKVVTSGTGGDEFFYGYEGTFGTLPDLMGHLRRIPRLVSKGLSKCLSPAGRLSPGAAKLARMLDDARNPSHCYDVFRGLFPKDGLGRLLADPSMGEAAGSVRMTGFLPGNWEETGAADAAGRRRIIKVLEAARYLGCQLLPDSDNFSMCHSLELRLPLVDRVVSEALEEIDDACFDAGGGGPKKSLLIEAVGDLPHALVFRRKQGFTLPIDDWMRGYEWKPKSGLLSPDACAAVDSAFRRGKLHWSRRWALEVVDHIAAGG